MNRNQKPTWLRTSFGIRKLDRSIPRGGLAGRGPGKVLLVKGCGPREADHPRSPRKKLSTNNSDMDIRLVDFPTL